jgi:cytochrome c-type biogenesis protein CcmH/NrfG
MELLKQQPRSAKANYLLASAYLATQDRDQALDIYRKMTEWFPTDPQPWLQMGAILAAQNQPLEARKALAKSAQIAPDFFPATERLIDLDLVDKQYAAALERVQKHIDKDPKAALAWAVRGRVYFAQRDLGRAEPDLLKAIELDPNLDLAVPWLGGCARLAGADDWFLASFALRLRLSRQAVERMRADARTGLGLETSGAACG